MNLIFTVVLIIFPVFREVSCTCDWPLEHRMYLFYQKGEQEFMMVNFLTIKNKYKIGLNNRYIEKILSTFIFFEKTHLKTFY